MLNEFFKLIIWIRDGVTKLLVPRGGWYYCQNKEQKDGEIKKIEWDNKIREWSKGDIEQDREKK